MCIKRNILVCCLLLVGFISWGQTIIVGQTSIDSTWRNKIYASRIPTLNDFYKCSESLIVARSKIDSTGHWKLSIPRDSVSGIVRIHISKKNYPVASLIIGGGDNNHAFIAIGETSRLNYSHSGTGLFSDFACETDPLNLQMNRIQSIFEAGENNYQKARIQKEKKEIRKALANELGAIADTISGILPAMYAAHLSDMGFNKRDVYRTMSRIETRLGSHPYLESYPVLNGRNGMVNTVMLLGGILLILYIGSRLAIRHRNYKRKRLLDGLSGREIEVFKLVVETKSNKEIADILNVEISTVKTHLHNIYSKLNVTSRNQLRRFS